MKQTQIKDALRNIRKQKVSFLSVVVIAVLGVTTFLGIDYAAAALRNNGSIAYNAMNYRDIEIISTLLLSPEDMDTIRSTDGVADAEEVWQTAAKAAVGGQRRDVSVVSVTQRVNLPALVEGRMPETAAECAVEKRIADESGWHVGDRIELVDAAGDTAKYLLGSEYEITGLVNHPDHANRNVPDTFYVLVLRDAFDMEALSGCCMRAEVVIEKEADADRFGEAYESAAAEVTARLEELSSVRTPVRDAEIQLEAQAKIEDGEARLGSAEKELSDARAELDDGWLQLAEGEQELKDGETRLAEAKKKLKAAWKKLEDAWNQLDNAQKQLIKANAELDSGAAGLVTAEAELDDAREQLLSGWDELEDAKAEIRDVIRSGVASVIGEDWAAQIPWASRQSADLSGSSSAADFWITDDLKFDISISVEEYLVRILSSPLIPDEVLISAYESITGGGEE